MFLVSFGFIVTGQIETINQNVYGIQVKETINSNFLNIQDSLDAVAVDSILDKQIVTPFEEEAYANPITIDFSTRNFKVINITGDITINITGLPEGICTLVINQDDNGRTITVGTGWGTVADSQATISTTSNAKNIIQFLNDGTDITYVVIVQGE